MQQNFVLLADAVPDIIQEIRYYTTYNFIGRRIDGYLEPCAILTKEAAAALKAASDAFLSQGYCLKVFDAYRPVRAVTQFVSWAEDDAAQEMKPIFYPDVEKADLLDIGYIARRSSHSRGSTVDLTLFDRAAGKEVDMGSPFDYFGKRSHADHTKHLTEAQIANRRLLQEGMKRHGFSLLKEEWWHFTLENEPYPDTYFDFPVCASEVK